MANLALLVADLTWARKASATAPMSVHVWRTLGKLALPTRPDEAREAFRRALALEPESCTNRYNLALAELAMARPAAALPLLEPCVHDAALGDKVRSALDDAHRRLPR
jgi:Flp pilus assembly protein TadD